MLYETQFLLALLLTTTVETATIIVAVYTLPFLRKRQKTLPQIIGAGIIPSVATLPYFWFVLPAYIKGYLPRILIGESGIFLTETVLILFLTRFQLRQCALLSFLANTASILAGLLVFR